MCVTAILNNVCDIGPLVICHNRDEYHQRAAEPLGRRPGQVIAGLDERTGGYWLALSHGAKTPFTTIVLNYRNMSLPNKERESRGVLVKELSSQSSKEDAINHYMNNFQRFSPHTIIIASPGHLFTYNTHFEQQINFQDGCHVFSNGSLTDSWPKQKRLANLLSSMNQSNDKSEVLDQCFESLKDTFDFPEESLPNTFVGLPMEKLLAPVFISSRTYGTRASTVIIFLKDTIVIEERSFDPTSNMVGKVHELIRLN